MKKTLLFLFMTFLSAGALWSQCVPSCSVYAVSPITYTTFPSAGTNPILTFTPNTDDGITPLIPIGFNFTFYCTTYTNLWICTNGFIQFNNGVPAIGTGFADPTQSFPSPSAPNAMVALNMNDLDPGVGGTITYTTVGTTPNQMFIVTYSNVPVFGYPTNLTNGQIILHETSNIIEIHTTGINNNGLTAGTQGIEDAFGSLGAPVPGRNNSTNWATPISNTAYQFSPYTPAPPSSLAGNTLLCQGDPASYQASFITNATGYVWTMPQGWLGTSTISALTATSGVSGTLSVSATYTCGTSLPITINVSVTAAPVVSIVSLTPAIICAGKTVTLNTTGAVTFTINPGGMNGLPTFTDMPLTTTVYTLTGTNSQGCISVNNPTVIITVKETPIVSINSGSMCLGETFSFTPSGANQYFLNGGFFFGTLSPTMVGVYTNSVTGTGTNGCVSDPSLSSVTVFSLPIVGAVATRTTMCLKESISITASGATSYVWGNASVNPSITVSPTTNTFYTVTGTNVHGCKSSATVNIAVKPCTGIEELSGSTDVKIYPNPTNGIFEIKLSQINDKTTIEIYNAIGQLIISENVQTETIAISLKNYSSGLYYVKVKNPAYEHTVKVIKQ